MTKKKKLDLAVDDPKTALILVLDPDIQEISRKTIEAMGHQCLFVKSREEAAKSLTEQPISLLIGTVRDKSDDLALFTEARKMCPTSQAIAILDESLEEYFPELLTRAYPLNLIADNQPLDFNELVTTIQKILSGDIFGMDKYGIPIAETIELKSSGEKYTVIEKARDFYRAHEVLGRITRNVELILNELLMNAIFDAPIDEKGEQLYYNRSRSDVFALQPYERPVMQYGIGDSRLAISISDPFGRFKADTFYSCVNRCFAEKSIEKDEGDSKGAGMGLFMAFRSLNQMVINVAYHKKTEVIAMIDHHASAGELKRRRHSFHYFHTGEVETE